MGFALVQLTYSSFTDSTTQSQCSTYNHYLFQIPFEESSISICDLTVRVLNSKTAEDKFLVMTSQPTGITMGTSFYNLKKMLLGPAKDSTTEMIIVSSVKTSTQAEKKVKLLLTSVYGSNFVYDSVLIIACLESPYL